MILTTGEKVDFIYFYKSTGCKYCDDFKKTKEALKSTTEGEMVELDCVLKENLDLAKKIFKLKVVPSLVMIVNKKFHVVDDISQLTLEELKERIEDNYKEHY